MTDNQIATYCDDVKETALRQFYKIQNQRKEIALLHKKCASQQAEIENYSHNIKNLTAENMQLQAVIKNLKGYVSPVVQLLNEYDIATARAEAIKEFADRLLNNYATYSLASEICLDAVGCDIKRLVKEMVGEDK